MMIKSVGRILEEGKWYVPRHSPGACLFNITYLVSHILSDHLCFNSHIYIVEVWHTGIA